MRLSDVDALQSAWLREFGEPVELQDLNGATVWSGQAVEEPPDSVEAPGSELSYEEPVHRLVFPRTARPDSMPRGSLLWWREQHWTVDETSRRDDHTLAVTVSHTPDAAIGVDWDSADWLAQDWA